MKKILLIDDNREMHSILNDILTPFGYEMISSTDSLKALNMITEVKPDLILADVMMPGMSGFELLREMKKKELNAIPVIFLSARAGRQDIEEGLKVGAKAYITKPFKMKHLLSVIAETLDKK